MVEAQVLWQQRAHARCDAKLDAQYNWRLQQCNPTRDVRDGTCCNINIVNGASGEQNACASIAMIAEPQTLCTR
jgi:hypothetical protein